jgi:hypothetical protein
MLYRNQPLSALLFITSGLFLMSCSNNDFSARPGSIFQQCVDVRPEVLCTLDCDATGYCLERYDYTITADQQVKDILFAVDVSGSMSDEQAQMGSQFPNLLNTLSKVDYRVAITTTDVRDRIDLEFNLNEPTNINGLGAFQDGNLVAFGNGRSFLDGSESIEIEQGFFDETITWEQTLFCEDANYQELFCPSGDERGILAAAMTLEKNPSDFIRPVGHMAVVILSDEDEGSNGFLTDPEQEEPQNFLDNFRALYPNKSISVHSIIIRPPEFDPSDLVSTNWRNDNGQMVTSDETPCFAQQFRPGHPRGRYGHVYAQLTQLTGGILGDICASEGNYSQQLQRIGESVSQVREVLPCRPLNDDVQVEFIPQPSYDVQVVPNFAQNEITFSEPLPEGTEIRFQFQCERD